MDVAELRDHIETDLPDPALQRILDAEQEAVDRVSSPSVVTDRFDCLGTLRLVLTRQAASISRIGWRRRLDEEEIELAEDDYRFEAPFELFRLPGGTNPAPRWVGRISVDYLPEADSEDRDRVLIALVRLSLAYEGLTATKVGDESISHLDYSAEREKLLGSLRTRRIPFA